MPRPALILTTAAATLGYSTLIAVATTSPHSAIVWAAAITGATLTAVGAGLAIGDHLASEDLPPCPRGCDPRTFGHDTD